MKCGTMFVLIWSIEWYNYLIMFLPPMNMYFFNPLSVGLWMWFCNALLWTRRIEDEGEVPPKEELPKRIKAKKNLKIEENRVDKCHRSIIDCIN